MNITTTTNNADPQNSPHGKGTLSAQERRDKMVSDAENETRELIQEIEQQRREGFVRRRWFEVLQASFG